jgi:hypothetical protein
LTESLPTFAATFEKELKYLSWASYFGYEKHATWRSGVDFINVLQADFMCADPKSAKKTVKLSVFFALLGSVFTKATHRTLMKLTPVGFHQYSYSQLLPIKIPKAQKDSQIISVFLCFWDLRVQKLLVKRWRNQPLELIK